MDTECKPQQNSEAGEKDIGHDRKGVQPIKKHRQLISWGPLVKQVEEWTQWELAMPGLPEHCHYTAMLWAIDCVPILWYGQVSATGSVFVLVF